MIGIKERELREIGVCAVCGEKMGYGGNPLFYRMTVELCSIIPENLKRQNALGEFLGNGHLAMIMGDDLDMAKVVMRTKPVLVHVGCRCSPDLISLVQAEGGNVLVADPIENDDVSRETGDGK